MSAEKLINQPLSSTTSAVPAGVRRKDVAASFVDTDGDMTVLQVDSTGNLRVALAAAAPAPTTEATFAAASPVAAAAIGAAYALAVDLPDGTKSVTIDNQTDGDVFVSMTAGASDTYHVRAGDSINIALAALGLVTTAAIHVKDGTTPSTAGSIYFYSIK